MNTFKKSGLVSAVAFALFAFNACGDDSNSTSASGENSTLSSAVEDDESLSSAIDSNKSSSSKMVESSDANQVESSSGSKTDENSSSSRMVASSSSIKGGSSSSYVRRQCENDETSTMIDRTCTVYFRCVDWKWTIDSTVCAEQPKEYPVMDSLFETKYSTYGSFEDPRDHQVCRTIFLSERDRDGNFVVDGKKIEVFAQNLNYGEMIDTSLYMHDDSKVEKYCELNDEWFCDNGWGGNYTWSEAMGLSAKYDSVLWKDTIGGDTRIHQGICPDNWHIMNAYEWKYFTMTSGAALASKVNWSPLNHAGANLSGMSVLFYMKSYQENWRQAWFLLPVEKNNDAVFYVLINDRDILYSSFGKRKHNTANIRCVRDY